MIIIAGFLGLLFVITGFIILNERYSKRNEEVFQFRFNLMFEGRYVLYNKYTYEEMLNSSKPLTLEAWFTEEEIKESSPLMRFLKDENKIRAEIESAKSNPQRFAGENNNPEGK